MGPKALRWHTHPQFPKEKTLLNILNNQTIETTPKTVKRHGPYSVPKGPPPFTSGGAVVSKGRDFSGWSRVAALETGH